MFSRDYILKFCQLKIVTGAVDAWKWSTKWRNWNIFDKFFSSSGSTIPFFSLCLQSHYRIGMVDVVHEPIHEEQAEINVWSPADFCGFGLEHAVFIHPIFEACSLNANVERWWNGHSSSHLPVLEYNDVDHCGLLCLNDLHQTPKVFLNVECH